MSSDDRQTNPRAQPIMEATLRLIGRMGIDAITHRAVAAEAGVSVGAISHHFESRDALVRGALQFAVERELDRLRSLSLELQSKVFDQQAWTKAVAAWYARDLEEDPETHIACFEAFLASARSARYRPLVREWFETYNRSMELVLRAAGSERPEEHAEVLVAALMGLVLQQLAQPRRGFLKRVASSLMQLIEGLVADRCHP